MIEDDDILEVQEYFRATLVARGPLPQEAFLGITEARIDIFDNDGELLPSTLLMAVYE